MEHKNNCLICGEELVYLNTSEKMKCFYCNDIYESNVKCEEGHYVCDKCHSMTAREIIKKYCLETDSEEPIEIMLKLLRHPSIKMHGPEHHFLVPAVLLAAYYNKIGDKINKECKIIEAEKRSAQILGGFCGFYGNCGAGVGTGIFISLITGATPLSGKEWGLSNLMTSKSLRVIAENGGPRCCKRNSYISVLEAVRFIKENMGVELKINGKIRCEYSKLNNECKKEKCLFYSK
ncbi:DUF5714 domain-containing protein [Clostridium aestuarii]|uniref:DUF5714 domain-containing protein n=1 Tax=Clostridium aestuarii TaxID=338193 RepID=A0ABT4D1J7_9CLOT|nr:DUF5714 domain-containing protein [Clostridium aestuarii]MCY6485114.1 DUF5714 domain-containing protein [Clostridium aestuarii]